MDEYLVLVDAFSRGENFSKRHRFVIFMNVIVLLPSVT
jgi:hypothetical protein